MSQAALVCSMYLKATYLEKIYLFHLTVALLVEFFF